MRPRRYRVTLKDIALETGYTVNTVARALRDKEDIAAGTRQVIQRKANELGYVANSIAGSMRSGSTRSIAAICGDISNPHFAIMLKGIENAARVHKYTTIILNTDEDEEMEREAILAALGRRVDGIIICPTQRSPKNIVYLQKTGVPFVLIGRSYVEPDTDYVVCDDFEGGRLATQHLIDRGHRRILFLNGPRFISSAEKRLAGYCAALADSGIPFDERLVREVPIVAGDCRSLIRGVMQEKLDFTGVFAFSDLIAWETMYTLLGMGLQIPRDMAIVGFDNIQSQFFFPFPLTSIGPSKTGMARRAFHVLMSRINAKAELPCVHEVLRTRLVVRSSS